MEQREFWGPLVGKEGERTPLPHPSKELIIVCSEKVAKKPMKIRQHVRINVSCQKSIKKFNLEGERGRSLSRFKDLIKFPTFLYQSHHLL